MSAIDRRIARLEHEVMPEGKTRFFFATSREHMANIEEQITAEHAASTMRPEDAAMIVRWTWPDEAPPAGPSPSPKEVPANG